MHNMDLSLWQDISYLSLSDMNDPNMKLDLTKNTADTLALRIHDAN